MSESIRPGDSAGVSVAAATGPLHPVLAPLAHMAALNEHTVWTWNAIGKADGAWLPLKHPLARH